MSASHSFGQQLSFLSLLSFNHKTFPRYSQTLVKKLIIYHTKKLIIYHTMTVTNECCSITLLEFQYDACCAKLWKSMMTCYTVLTHSTSVTQSQTEGHSIYCICIGSHGKNKAKIILKITVKYIHSFFAVKTDIHNVTVVNWPRLRHPRVFVHFHSFSCVATFTSSMTSGTQPPNTNIRWPTTVAECRLRGKGGTPWTNGFDQDIVTTTHKFVFLHYINTQIQLSV